MKFLQLLDRIRSNIINIKISEDLDIIYKDKYNSTIVRDEISSIPWFKYVNRKFLYHHRSFFFSCNNWAKTIRDAYVKLKKESGTKGFRQICYTNSRASSWIWKLDYDLWSHLNPLPLGSSFNHMALNIISSAYYDSNLHLLS